MASLFCCSFLTFAVFAGLSVIVEQTLWFRELFFVELFAISVYTVVVGAIVFPLLEHWLKLVLPNRQYELF